MPDQSLLDYLKQKQAEDEAVIEEAKSKEKPFIERMGERYENIKKLLTTPLEEAPTDSEIPPKINTLNQIIGRGAAIAGELMPKSEEMPIIGVFRLPGQEPKVMRMDPTMGIMNTSAQLSHPQTGMYSNLEKLMVEKMGNKATPEQVMAIAQGAKPEEVEWTNLKQFLTNKDKVNKEDVIKHIQENQPGIKKITLGEDKRKKEIKYYEALSNNPEVLDLERKMNDLYQIENPTLEQKELMDEYQNRLHEINTSIPEYNELQNVENPHFHKWATPNAEQANYREHLYQTNQKDLIDNKLSKQRFDLEKQIKTNEQSWSNKVKALREKRQKELEQKLEDLEEQKNFSPTTTEELEQKRALRKQYDETLKELNSNNFNYSPEDSQTLSDLYDDFNKQHGILFNKLNEIKDQQRANKSFYNQHFDQPDLFVHTRTTDRLSPNDEKHLLIEEIQSDWAKKAHRTGGFKGDVYPNLNPKEEARLEELDLKSMSDSRLTDKELDERANLLSKKAKGGDPISGPPSHMPFKKSHNEFALKSMINQAIDEGKDAVSWVPGAEHTKRYYTPQIIEDGERIGQNINKQRDQADTFYKNFYDKQLVDYGNKLGKKYGFKVEKSKVLVGPQDAPIEQEVWSIKLSPEVKAKIKEEGLPLWSKGGVHTDDQDEDNASHKYPSLRDLLNNR